MLAAFRSQRVLAEQQLNPSVQGTQAPVYGPVMVRRIAFGGSLDHFRNRFNMRSAVCVTRHPRPSQMLSEAARRRSKRGRMLTFSLMDSRQELRRLNRQ